MALAGRAAPLASQLSSKKHRMHPQAAVFAPRFQRLGWAGVVRWCMGCWLAGRAGWWLIALRLRQGKGKARRRMRHQPGARASSIRRGRSGT